MDKTVNICVYKLIVEEVLRPPGEKESPLSFLPLIVLIDVNETIPTRVLVITINEIKRI